MLDSFREPVEHDAERGCFGGHAALTSKRTTRSFASVVIVYQNMLPLLIFRVKNFRSQSLFDVGCFLEDAKASPKLRRDFQEILITAQKLRIPFFWSARSQKQS